MVNCRFISVFLILLLLYVYIQLVARGPARRDISFHYIKHLFDYMQFVTNCMILLYISGIVTTNNLLINIM